MAMQPGIVSPDSYPIRRPTDPNMKNGRCAGQPHYQKMGGLSGEGKWGGNTEFHVEKPNRLKTATPNAARKDNT